MLQRRLGGNRGIAGVSAAESGFTIAEILVAVTVVSIGLVGFLTAAPVAMSGIATGKQQATAAFLAEQRLEELRSTAVANFAAVAAGTTTEAYNTIANAPGYRRTTVVTDNPGGTTNTKLIQVTVSYMALQSGGMAVREASLVLSTLVASRQ